MRFIDDIFRVEALEKAFKFKPNIFPKPRLKYFPRQALPFTNKNYNLLDFSNGECLYKYIKVDNTKTRFQRWYRKM